MSIKQPEVGDTVVIRGVVTYSDCMMFRFKQDGTNSDESMLVPNARISEIIPKPWEPKVGEEVDIGDHLILKDRGFTILNIHGDGSRMQNGLLRRWATVSFKDDRPEIYNIEKLSQRVKN